MSRMSSRVDPEVLVNNDVSQPGHRRPGSKWTFGLELGRKCTNRLTDHRQISQDRVVRHLTVAWRAEIGAIADAAINGRQYVLQPLAV